MDELEQRQDEHELSMVSLARLEVLLSSLRSAANRPAGAFPDFERRLQQRRLQSWRDHFREDAMVVGPAHEGAARDLIGAIEEAVHGIAGRLNDEWRRGGVDTDFGADHGGQVWTIGAVTFSGEQYPILRGAIELRKTEPIAAGMPQVLVEFLVTVPGTRDKITRENHGHWGYHYHYLDSKDRRSDTLLTFDQNRSNLVTPTLCWERHAEAHGFQARAGKWGTEKRESVYSVCHPDTSRFSLLNFKRPASDAQIVWPLAVAVAATPVA